MCGGIRAKPAADRRMVYCERTDDPRLGGRLRAIADRAQGTLDDPLTARALAEACEKACGSVGAAFWHAYVEEVESPSDWPIRRCDICRAEVVPAALGAYRVLCPICRPLYVRVETLEREIGESAERAARLAKGFRAATGSGEAGA